MSDPKKKKVVKRKNRVTAVKNTDGTTTKTRVRRDGSVKKVKTYKDNKTVASNVVKYRKDGTKKKTVTRPGNKSGTVVSKTNKKGKTTTYNKKKRLKRNLQTAGKLAGIGAGIAGASATGAIVPIVTGMAAKAGIDTVRHYATDSRGKLKKLKPLKSMQNAANWIKKGVKNKIQTGNRKGRTKKTR